MIGLRRVEFKPVSGYWFTSYLIESLKSKTGCFKVTLDIGISESTVCVDNNHLVIGELRLSFETVTPSEVDRVVIVEQDGKAYEITVYSERGFYKLKAAGLNNAPTLEISGIHMHRIVGIDPWTDTLCKVEAARVRPGCRVLDTCTGLGYTAIGSVQRGAVEVYTYEVDENVIWVAERNPWSRALVNPSIHFYLADVTEAVYQLPGEYFHRVIHDPPRFSSSTGHLYSLEFYRELFRVLKPRGVLFHYTGEPRRHGAPSILKGIKERLERAGFAVLKYDRRAQGFVAVKRGF